ncbi:unnamed protein product [Cylindrotheca closterium]|uniref:Uncharacterized protein n=1 Tax=Cylindrotheca closterium TaxID=2856 RepID=A0AAD2FE54_9STRA|nr:unnamed protein product [Cylindrotheca closterium]
MKQGTTENLMHFKERFLRQAEVLQDLYGVAWFQNFAVKTKAYAAIASTDTTAKDKFKDDIFEATNYCREVDYYPKTVSKAHDMLKIHMDVIKNPGVNLYQGKDQPNKGKGKGKGKGKPKDEKKKAACYVRGKEDNMSPKCPDRLLPEIQWKHPKHYVDYGKKLNLNQIGATVPTTATVLGTSPATSVAGTTGNQIMQVPSGMQLMQIPTQGRGTVTVPYSMNANNEIAFSGMQLSQQGFSGAQVRQGSDATQAQTPQVVKTGYFDTSNVFNNAIKRKDENGNDVYPIPCPTGMTNVELQSDWHYANKSEDLPDLATEKPQNRKRSVWFA